MMRARLTELARLELREAATWIAADSPRAAAKFRDAVGRACRLLAEHPYSGTRSDFLIEPFRRIVLQGFPYVLIYDASQRPPVVVRVLHGARNLPTLLAAYGPSNDR